MSKIDKLVEKGGDILHDCPTLYLHPRDTRTKLRFPSIYIFESFTDLCGGKVTLGVNHVKGTPSVFLHLCKKNWIG